MTRPLPLTNLEFCWDSLDDLFGSLGDDQWSVQSLCPDWDVAGILMHLAAIEAMLAGKGHDSFAEGLPFEEVGAFIAELDGASPSDLLARYRSIIDERRNDLADLDDAALEHPSMTPVGPGTYGRFMAVRVFDFWVHEQDVRRPLDMPGHEAGPAAEMAIDEIEMSLGYIVGKKIGLPDGESITIELTGPVTRTMHVDVQGRATAVESLDDPTVTLTADSTTFALLACGRIDPQAEIDAGTISWTGRDEVGAEWGDKAARSLAFTM